MNNQSVILIIALIFISAGFAGIIPENNPYQLWALQENIEPEFEIIDTLNVLPVQNPAPPDTLATEIINPEPENVILDTTEIILFSGDNKIEFPSDSLINEESVISSPSNIEDTTSTASNKIVTNMNNYKFPGKAMLMSGVLPGLGELYSGSPLKAMLFAGIEASAWMYWSSLQEKIESKELKYKTFANEKWDFKRWVENYYSWSNYQDTVIIDGVNMRSLFSEQVGENEYDYMHINEGSHTIYFYDPRFGKYVTFPDSSPTPLTPTDYVWCEDWEIFNTDWVCFNWALNADFQEHLNSGEILVQKNLHFYENVGKYNHFFMGWEQAQLVVVDSLPLENGLNNIGEDITYWNVTTLSGSPISQGTFQYDGASGILENTSSNPWEQYIAVKLIYTRASVFDNDGYLVAKSPDKWKYRNLRDEYNKLGKVAGYAISAVMFNHVVSMIDAVISTNSYNRRQSNRISAVPVFNPNAKFGVSGITLNFRF